MKLNICATKGKCLGGNHDVHEGLSIPTLSIRCATFFGAHQETTGGCNIAQFVILLVMTSQLRGLFGNSGKSRRASLGVLRKAA
jgi:hypothetical protein